MSSEFHVLNSFYLRISQLSGMGPRLYRPYVNDMTHFGRTLYVDHRFKNTCARVDLALVALVRHTGGVTLVEFTALNVIICFLMMTNGVFTGSIPRHCSLRPILHFCPSVFSFYSPHVGISFSHSIPFFQIPDVTPAELW